MKKVILLILFVILQTNVFARNCQYSTMSHGPFASNETCGLETANNGHSFGCNVWSSGGNWAHCGSTSIPVNPTCKGVSNSLGGITCQGSVYCCTDQCAADSLSCQGQWNSKTCTCLPPPCEVFERCETYWNTGNGLGVSIGQGIAAQTDRTTAARVTMQCACTSWILAIIVAPLRAV